MKVSEYAEHDGTALAGLIASKAVAPSEVRAAALEAIAQVDRKINAVVHGPFDDAPEPVGGHFRGVPFAVKDTLFEAGRPIESGSRLLSGNVAAVDQTLAVRFREAGLVTLVRTATPEFAFNLDTSPVVNGSTRNPWALDRSAGGSSGGSAALVAAGAVPMAHGNDGGGSIRLPAGWCGLVGLKPTRGRVPVGPGVGEALEGLAHEFALTRTVRDAAALLDAVAGPSPGDRYYVARSNRSFADEVGVDPGPLRIALHTTSYWGRETEPAIREAVEATARTLEEMGHIVEEAAPPVRAESLHRAHLVLWTKGLAGTAATGRALGREPSPETLEAASLACVEHGRRLRLGDVARAQTTLNALSRAWGEFLDRYDLFLCPTTPTAAPPVGSPAQDDPRYSTAEAWLADVFDFTPYTPIANATGQPSVSLPLGLDPTGVPIGVMLTAQSLRDDLLFRVASQLEDALPWSTRRPTVYPS